MEDDRMKWTCEQCEREYVPTKTYQRFCNDVCRKNWHLRQYHERKAEPKMSAEDVLKMAGVAPAEFQRRY
jgi:hypothetical protein